ncbi:MAG: methyltransferase domain-containing protein [Bacteroidota bacterium]
MKRYPPDFRNTWSDADVEAHWDRVASIYVEENDKLKDTHDQRFVESVDSLQLEAGFKVINISSRDCEANDYILKKEETTDVYNTEISSGLMGEAKKYRPYVKQIKIDTYSSLPYEDEYFDRILTLETLEHVEQPLQFLNELHRIAKPGARMVLSCPPATSEIPYRLFTFLFGGHGEGPHKFPPSRTVKKWLEQTGWKLLSHKGTLLMPVGPKFIKDFGEKIISSCQGTFIAELGIRQFFVCEKS